MGAALVTIGFFKEKREMTVAAPQAQEAVVFALGEVQRYTQVVTHRLAVLRGT